TPSTEASRRGFSRRLNRDDRQLVRATVIRGEVDRLVGRQAEQRSADRGEDRYLALLDVGVARIHERYGTLRAFSGFVGDGRAHANRTRRYGLVFGDASALQLVEQFVGKLRLALEQAIGKL